MERTATIMGNTQHLMGTEVIVGSKLPAVKLTGLDMGDQKISNTGKVTLVISVPSLDTPVCQLETKRFNEELNKINGDIATFVVSLDLPFAQKRWCALESTNKLTVCSDYKYREFGEAYGTYMKESGLLSRAVFIADKNGDVKYVEYVAEVGNEPNYANVLNEIAKLVG